jgi:hypothetical protein
MLQPVRVAWSIASTSKATDARSVVVSSWIPVGLEHDQVRDLTKENESSWIFE